MSELNDFAIEIDRCYEEVYQRILDDCEMPKDVLAAFKQQFSRYTVGGQSLKRYDCQPSANGLTIDKAILYRNSFALQMNLELATLENATRIICRFRVHVLVKLFMVLFSAPLVLIALAATGGLIFGVIGGTKKASDAVVLLAFPLLGGFLAALYFGGRKISEPNAVELKNWLLGLFPYRTVNIEK